MKSCDTTPLLAYDDALAQLTDSVTVRVETVEMPLLQARGAILAETVVADIDVPGCAMSAMDGYAVNTADLGADDVTRLPLSQRIAAGDAEATLTPGTAARIFTGAPVPTGADAVIMQEQVEVENGFVSFEQRPKSGQNVRPAGNDIKNGSEILQRGCRLRPQDIGLAASVGRQNLSVFKRPS